MVIPIVSLLIAILIAGVILWAIEQLPGIADPMKRIARVIIVVFTVIYVIYALFGHAGAVRFS